MNERTHQFISADNKRKLFAEMFQREKDRETMVEKAELALKRATEEPTRYDPAMDENRKVVGVVFNVTDASLHIYKRPCSSVHLSARPFVGWSVRNALVNFKESRKEQKR